MKKSTEKNLNEKTTRERLLDVATEQFAAQGYEKTTVRDICKQADANLNSIKHHFGDKWALYIAVIDHCKESSGGPPVVPDVPLDASAEKQLYLFIHSMVKMVFRKREKTRDVHAFQLLMREMQNPSGALKPGIKMFIIPIWKLLNRILKKLLPEDVDESDRYLLAFSVMGQINSYRFNTPVMNVVLTKTERDRFTAKRVAEHITRVTLAAAKSHHSGH